MAFDGTEIFYSDETLAYVQVYSPTGTLVRTLPKPAGNEPGTGLGVSTTTLFLVGLDSTITPVNKATGVAGASFVIPGASHGLTFAGSRDSIFVTVNDSTTIKELSTAGAVLNTITVPAVFRGLGFSSSAKVLFGTRAGLLYAVDPDTGAGLAGYPVDIKNMSLQRPNKTGALAADEPVLESCGDGRVNPRPRAATRRARYSRTGRSAARTARTAATVSSTRRSSATTATPTTTTTAGTTARFRAAATASRIRTSNATTATTSTATAATRTAASSRSAVTASSMRSSASSAIRRTFPAATPSCHATEICTDLVDDDGDGRIDCLDDDCDCLPIGRDPGAIRFGKTGQKDLFSVHGSLDPASSFSLGTEDIKFLLSNANGKVLTIIIPAGKVKQIGRNLFRFKDPIASATATRPRPLRPPLLPEEGHLHLPREEVRRPLARHARRHVAAAGDRQRRILEPVDLAEDAEGLGPDASGRIVRRFLSRERGRALPARPRFFAHGPCREAG